MGIWSDFSNLKGCRFGILLLIMVLFACQPKVIITKYYGVPSLAPGTKPEMNTPGFWIGRHPDPDAVIMSEQDIADFNTYIRKKTKAVRDILQLSDSRDGGVLESSLRKMFAENQGYVDAEGKKMTKGFLDNLESVMGLSRIPPAIAVRWAYVVRPCDQRLLPTAKPFYKSATDTSIDRLQNNALDAATPILVLIESTDHAWFYAISPDSEGWIASDKVALCRKDDMARCEASTTFVVATDPKADIYADPLLRQHLLYIHMGARLPLLKDQGNGAVQVLIPVRTDEGLCTFGAGFIAETQVHQGYLPYTPRNAIVQAFKLLNTPYGWGGMYGEQDCSRFVQEVFAAMGVMLPRNSSQQGRVGRLLASFTAKNPPDERRRILDADALGGITTLQFPGHIMLFLGFIDGIPYAIHDLYAYTEPAQPDEKLVNINRVVVSSLAVGEGTKKDSLLMRLGTVRELSPEPQSN